MKLSRSSSWADLEGGGERSPASRIHADLDYYTGAGTARRRRFFDDDDDLIAVNAHRFGGARLESVKRASVAVCLIVVGLGLAEARRHHARGARIRIVYDSPPAAAEAVRSMFETLVHEDFGPGNVVREAELDEYDANAGRNDTAAAGAAAASKSHRLREERKRAYERARDARLSSVESLVSPGAMDGLRSVVGGRLSKTADRRARSAEKRAERRSESAALPVGLSPAGDDAGP